MSRSPYFSPLPVVPAALGRGCSWRRCTFCPDHLHPAYGACGADALAQWVRETSGFFPAGVMIHLTDSALPPALLERLAEVVRAESLPVRWHGFARMEERFADPDFALHLAEGGCAMIQWGLETASPRLLELLGKGVPVDLARRILRSFAAAGVKNLAYLLFGIPTETDADRGATLDFVRAEAGAIGDLNVSLLNLPRGSPMHRDPSRHGITDILPFGDGGDLSLCDDFRCGASHPRLEARRWLGRRFTADTAVKRILGGFRAPFKANHSCFLP